MSFPAKSSSETGSSPAFDRYFEISLYLLSAAGFATLATSRGVDIFTILLVAVAFAVRGFLLITCISFAISDRWTTPLTVGYFAFFAVDYFSISRSFLTSTVHLVLFGVVVRMFSLRRERDHVMLAILAFLMVLASAVLTVDSVFLFCFAVFMLMAVITFVLLEMRRSARVAGNVNGPMRESLETRRFAVWLMRLGSALVCAILVGSALLFFLLPRMSAGYLGAYSFGTDLSTGFSDHVKLGQIGQIQQSTSLVMHIQIEGDNDGRHDLRWRGVALSFFDGQSWSNRRERFVLNRLAENDFEIPPIGSSIVTGGSMVAGTNRVSHRGQIIRYQVLQEPIGTNVFFLAPWARRVVGDYRALSIDGGGAVYDLDSQHPVHRYDAESDIGKPTAAELRAAEGDYPPEISDTNLELPPLDPRIRDLAFKIAGSAANNFNKAAAVETYLKTHYAYTLQLPRTASSDPLANFLFERRQGHCEYFASAMAVMLRVLGIPSRVVNGFRSDEFNDITSNYVVRAKDAHAWVEAYFPGYGWQEFDPTPAGVAGTPQGWKRLALYLDAASSFWQDWIVSYDSAHQYIAAQTALNQTHDFWERMRIAARRWYSASLTWAQRGEERFGQQEIAWKPAGIALAVALLLLTGFLALQKFIRNPLRSSASPQHVASIWYERTVRLLSRHGVHKSAAKTPKEFVQTISDVDLRQNVARFTAVYESARFGNSSSDAEKLRELYQEVELAAKK